MSETVKCPTCGTDLLPGALPGQCPRCLFGLGLEAAQEPKPRKGRHHFGGYDLVRQIGCGGMGVVYEASQACLNRPVALKMILGAESCSPKTRRRFFIEAEAAARLDHPNIVPIYEVGEYEEQPFIAMKLVHGVSLRDRIVRGETGLAKNGQGQTASVSAERQKEIARLMATMARAVHHAHQHNVVHRDIKPENILIDADGTPYLTDFGLAKLLDPDRSSPTAKTEFLGTLIYMSPEQIRSEGITAATDVYGLGVTLYELLAGRVPFRGATPNETLQAIETRPATQLRRLNRSIQNDLDTICLKCLEKSPGARYGTALEVAEDLERWLNHQPIKARQAGMILHVIRWNRRNPMAAALILSLVVALLAAIGLYAQNRKKNDLERERNALIVQQIMEQTGELWRDPRRTNLVISADRLALISNQPSPDTNGALRLTFEINIQENPVAQALAYVPLLSCLQEQMGRHLPQRVLFDIKFCKNGQHSYHEIVSGQTDFQRLGAVSYLRAQDLSPGVRAVVGDDIGKDTVIFVRRDSPITILSQFAGHSFAFGDTNSTMNLWVKQRLVASGVRATNLSYFTNFNESVWSDDGVAVGTSSTTNTDGPRMVSGAEAARRVLAGEFDGAVLQRHYYEQLRYKKGGLREVATFSITPNVYVARAGLDAAIVRAFSNAMLSLTDPKVLGQIPRKPPLKGFQPVDEKEFENLRRVLENDAPQFDGMPPSPHPTPIAK